MKKETHDLVIVGAGPAGLTAAIYAARYKIDFALVGRMPGGNLTDSYNVENYPGFDYVIPGHDLANNMAKQLKRFGGEPKMDEIQSIERVKGGFKLTGNNTEYIAGKVLLALGMERNKLNIPGEHELEGRGVAYCATCDGYFYKDRVVAVVGGGDSAVNAALYLADIAKKVYLIVRKPEMRAEPTCQDNIRASKKVEIICEANVKEIKGVEKVESIVLDKKNREIKVDGVFIEVGQTPQSVLEKGLGIKTNDKEMIIVKGNQRTSVKGVWAAGDITTNSDGLRQIVTACAEGAVAVVDIFKELKKSK